MNKNTKKIFKYFVNNFKKPIFILGIISWIVLFVVMMTESFSIVKTGYAISTSSTLGISGSQFVVLLFVVLSILMFLMWRFLIKDLRKEKHKNIS